MARIAKPIAIKSPKPKGLVITRDENGVPHIQAQNINDLNWGIGYCQAIDRATQLQMMRIIGQGRLCELLEDSEDNLKIDVFFRRMGWFQNDLKETSKLNPETREWCQALCDGINAGLKAKGWSVLKLMGYQAETWRIQDILLILRMTSYLTLAQSQEEIERLFIELVQADLSDEQLTELFPVEAEQIDRELINKIKLEERALAPEMLWEIAAPRTMASNSWVVSGQKTKSGSAMMANDPHLEVNRLPNVWYEFSLSCPDYQGMGYGMPGLPGLLIGRTPDIAWGATYTFMDSVDSWVEHCKEKRYKRGKSWRKFDERVEIIKRKKNKDHSVTFYENKHGVLSGIPEEESYLLCTSWSPAFYGARSLNASYQLTQAQNTESAMSALGAIESSWNWVVSDRTGNIGYQMSGLAPKRKEGWNGLTPLAGWDTENDWQGFYSHEDLPKQYNPEDGYIVTANNDLNEYGNIPPINMPMGDYRARRISECLKNSDTHDVNSFKHIQMDTYSIQAKEFLEVLLPILDDAKYRNMSAAKTLKAWDCRYDKNSRGAVLFEKFYACLREEIFGVTPFKPEAIEHLNQNTGLFIDFYDKFDKVMLNPESSWYRGRKQATIFSKAFDRATMNLDESNWGDINQFKFTNILFQGKLPAWLGFDSKPCSMIGGRATPHQGQIYKSAGRQTSFAPSVRIVCDMSDKHLYTRTAGGVSDNRFSPWYRSEIQGWLEGSFKQLKL